MSILRNTGGQPLRGRRIARVVSAIGLAALVGGVTTLTACADAPSSLEPAAQAVRADKGGVSHESPIRVTGLKRATPLTHNVTASVTLYNSGGVLHIPEAGLHVNIPKTALPANDRPITITVTALAGDQIAYEFGPSGTRFKAPLRVTQDLSDTEGMGHGEAGEFEANYFKGLGDLDPASGTALSYETIPTRFVATGNRLHWDVWHFSGYIVCWGRR